MAVSRDAELENGQISPTIPGYEGNPYTSEADFKIHGGCGLAGRRSPQQAIGHRWRRGGFRRRHGADAGGRVRPGKARQPQPEPLDRGREILSIGGLPVLRIHVSVTCCESSNLG